MASLSAAQEQVAELGCQVVVISFGKREGALRWKEDTKCPFPIFLDAERKLYKYFGMKRSIAQCWSRQTLSYYVKIMMEGRNLVVPYLGVEDDPIQMGGDIIVTSEGAVKKQHLSQFSADRPNIQSFLNEIK